MAIDISFNEDQQLIADSAKDFFARECAPTAIRAHEKSGEEYSKPLWKQMAELGWLGMGFAETYGGSGSSSLDLVALHVEIGRAIAPVPFLESVTLAGQLISANGSEAQKQKLLPRIASGELIVAPAILEADASSGPKGIELSALRMGGGWQLDGVKVLVPCAKSAGLFVVPARTGIPGGAEGVTLFLVDAKVKGLSIEATPTMTGQPMSALALKGVKVADADILGRPGGGWPALDAALMRAAILQSAMVVGAGEQVRDISARYARERVQFGKPIGSYQAVQYLCTDIAIEVHLTRLFILQAAWRLDQGLTWFREAALAKAAANKAAWVLINRSHEVHAGIGFMLDYDLQLYTRRAKHWEYQFGDRRYHLERSMEETVADHGLV